MTIAIAMASCLDDPDCISGTTNFVNIKFYNIQTSAVDSVTVSSVRIVGSDSILVENDTIVSIILPLNPKTNESTYVFNTEYGLDTVVFSYATNSRIISEDCGIDILFTGLDYLRSDFDSTSVINREVLSETITEDVQIFN